MYEEKVVDSRYIEQLRSLPSAPHDDNQDVAALAPPPTAGILGAVAASLLPELKEKPHVEIPQKPDIFKPTKSMLDILSECIDSDLNKQLFSIDILIPTSIYDNRRNKKRSCN